MSSKLIVDLINQTLPEVAEHSLKTRLPVAASVLLNSKPIIDFLISNEPGPKVDWKSYQVNLKILAPFLATTTSGPDLLFFFKQMIDFRSKYLIACASHEASLMNFRLCANFFRVRGEQWRSELESDDPDPGWKEVTGGGLIHRHKWLQDWEEEVQDESKLTWAHYLARYPGQSTFTEESEFLNNVEDHKSIKQQYANFLSFQEQRDRFETDGDMAKLQQNIAVLHAQREHYTVRLFTIKTSKNMWINSGRLWHCCKGYEVHLLKQRSAEATQKLVDHQNKMDGKGGSKGKAKLVVSDRGSPMWTRKTAKSTQDQMNEYVPPALLDWTNAFGDEETGGQNAIDPKLFVNMRT